MKRPPGLWLLLSAGVLWLSLQDVYGIRATALIFGKSSTTTTTTTEGSAGESSPDESGTEAITEAATNTTGNFTGNPQLDYIYDPNLPKELNGYNLSAYPFYERVPEEIDFKCDGLHDGFYASVPHKCQVYHHCLFGTRFDFLCANYTAFDQKTFICHFVSEVDCVNSKKYWHRNDALYQAASTTTVKPVVVSTAPPQPPPALVSAAGGPPRRPGGGGRRYLRKKRPQFDYYDYEEEYDDYYEERPSRSEPRRRKRPRPRPRPVYEDEYEEYDDAGYERRGTGRRRAPERRRNNERRKYADDDERERTTTRRYHKRRPSDDDVVEEDDRRRNRPKSNRRPVEYDYEEEELPRKDKPSEADVEDKPIIKPTSGSSIFDRPRAAPRIKPPVPKSEASKYAYKPVVTKPPPVEDEEYYDDYEEEARPKSQKKNEGSESRRHTTRHEEERDTRKQSGLRLRASQSSREETSSEEDVPRRPHKPKHEYHRERPRSSNKKPPPLDDYYDELEETSKEDVKPEKSKYKPTTTTTEKPTTTTTITTTTTSKPAIKTPKDTTRSELMVRIVKRPFLPSRGGNPLMPRGLQPVGSKALDKKPEEEEEEEEEETAEVKPVTKTVPVIIKMPHRQKYTTTQTEPAQEEFKPVSNRPQVPPRQSFKSSKDYSGPRTTQKPKLPDPDPLDIEDEYDVTLNDALNPTLPNLPIRGYPTGFSNYNTFQRPSGYVLEAASSEYKPNKQRFEAVPFNNPQEHFVNSNADYKGQYSTITRESYRPRVTQAYFSSF